jgi:hypothetical protein
VSTEARGRLRDGANLTNKMPQHAYVVWREGTVDSPQARQRFSIVCFSIVCFRFRGYMALHHNLVHIHFFVASTNLYMFPREGRGRRRQGVACSMRSAHKCQHGCVHPRSRHLEGDAQRHVYQRQCSLSVSRLERVYRQARGPPNATCHGCEATALARSRVLTMDGLKLARHST